MVQNIYLALGSGSWGKERMGPGDCSLFVESCSILDFQTIFICYFDKIKIEIKAQGKEK